MVGKDVLLKLGVSKNMGTLKSSILMGVFHYKLIHFGDTPIFGNAQIVPFEIGVPGREFSPAGPGGS